MKGVACLGNKSHMGVAHSSGMSSELITHVHVIGYLYHGWKEAEHCRPGVLPRVMA